MASSSTPATRERQVYTAHYPGYEPVELHIIVDNLAAARAGDSNMQASIVMQYRGKLGLDRTRFMYWRNLRLTPVTSTSPTSPRTQRPPTTRHVVERYGCTCEAPNCGACDQMHHSSCRYGCKHGQPVS